MKIFIKRSQSFPSFHTIRNDLKLEKIKLDHSAAQGQAIAFYSALSGGEHPPQQQLPPCPPSQELPERHTKAPPPPASNPNNGGKGKGKDKGKEKDKNHDSGGSNNNSKAPRRDPPSTIPRLTPSRCGQGCVLRSCNWHVHHNTPCLLHRRTTGLPAAPPSCPYQCLHRTSSRPRPLPGHPGHVRGINSHWPTPSARRP
jgi:hypothetical protein